MAMTVLFTCLRAHAALAPTCSNLLKFLQTSASRACARTITSMATKPRPHVALPESWGDRPVVLVLDGTNLLHRSHHAMSGSGLTGRDGSPVWALHGLGVTLARLVEDTRPHRIVTALDTGGGCPARRLVAPEYKGTRKEPDRDLLKQLIAAPGLLGAARLGAATADGWEADDLMASAVTEATARGWASVVVSSDRDAYQLISDSCVVAKPDGTTWDEQALLTNIGVSPLGYRHLAAIRGEQSDNLTGVPGWGEKTAVKLLTMAADPRVVLESADALDQLTAIVGAKAAARFIEHAGAYRRNLEVGHLRTDLPIGAALDSAPDVDATYQSFHQAGLVAAAAKLSVALKKCR